MERGVYQYAGRGRQLLRFDGFQYGNITPTDFDAVIEYRSRVWVLFEAKLAGKDVPAGQRKALERWVKDAKRAGKYSVAMIVEHNVIDSREDILLRDCLVRELFSTETLTWRPPRQPITAMSAATAYIEYAINRSKQQLGAQHTGTPGIMRTCKKPCSGGLGNMIFPY